MGRGGGLMTVQLSHKVKGGHKEIGGKKESEKEILTSFYLSATVKICFLLNSLYPVLPLKR